MKIQIVLIGSGGELDRQTIDTSDDSAEMSNSIFEALKAWVLSPGDTIVIKEVE